MISIKSARARSPFEAHHNATAVRLPCRYRPTAMVCIMFHSSGMISIKGTRERSSARSKSRYHRGRPVLMLDITFSSNVRDPSQISDHAQMEAVLRQRLIGTYCYSMIHVTINSIYIVRHIEIINSLPMA